MAWMIINKIMKNLIDKPYAPILILVIFEIMLCGYSSDSQYVPLILQKANPQLYPSDLFVNSSYILNSFYFGIMGFLSRYIELNLLFSVLSFMVAYADGLAVFYLTMVLFKNKGTAYLAVFLLLLSKSAISVAGIGITPSMEPSGVVVPFLLLSIILFLKKYYWQAGLIISAMFYIQGMQASFVAGMFLFHFLMEIKNLDRKKVFLGIVCMILPAVPIFWDVFSGVFSNIYSAQDIKYWWKIIHMRSWYHLFPFSWGVGDWFKYFGLFIWGFIVFYLHKPKKLPHQHIIIMNFIKAIFLMCVVSTVFSEIFVLPFIVRLILWRSTRFFVLFLLIYMSNYFIEFPNKKTWQSLLIAITVSSIFLSLSKIITCFSLVFLGIEVFQYSRKKLAYFISMVGLGGFLLFIVGTVLPMSSEKIILRKAMIYSNLGGEMLFILFCFFVCIFLYVRCLSLKIRMGRVIMVICLLFLFTGTFIKARKWQRIMSSDIAKDWKSVQFWAKKNTKIDSVFITPIYIKGFRIHSQRGTVLEFKDGGPVMHDIGYCFKWWERVNDFGYNSLKINLDMRNDLRRIYKNLNIEDVYKLSKKYGANYIVTESKHALDLKKLYQNEHFEVFFIK